MPSRRLSEGGAGESALAEVGRKGDDAVDGYDGGEGAVEDCTGEGYRGIASLRRDFMAEADSGSSNFSRFLRDGSA